MQRYVSDVTVDSSSPIRQEGAGKESGFWLLSILLDISITTLRARGKTSLPIKYVCQQQDTRDRSINHRLFRRLHFVIRRWGVPKRRLRGGQEQSQEQQQRHRRERGTGRAQGFPARDQKILRGNMVRRVFRKLLLLLLLLFLVVVLLLLFLLLLRCCWSHSYFSLLLFPKLKTCLKTFF